MKRAQTLFVSFVIVAGAISIFSQQTAPGTAQAPVELSSEPHHHLVLENEYVRVWNTLIPAGESTLWHAHRNDNVVISLSDAAVRVETAGAAPVDSQAKFGDVGFRQASYVHRTMSTGKTLFHNMAIELLRSPPSDNAAKLKQSIGREPLIDNDKVRVYRLSLAPGETAPMHAHLLPGLGIMLAPGEIEVQIEGKANADRLKVAAGEARWRPGAVIHAVRNVGKTRFEAVDIELK